MIWNKCEKRGEKIRRKSIYNNGLDRISGGKNQSIDSSLLLFISVSLL